MPGDTANTLYQRVMELEFEVFKEAWPRLVAGDFERRLQRHLTGTSHKRKDLFTQEVQRIDLSEALKAGDLLRRLRALTTSRFEEAAYYEVDGRRYRVQVQIREEPG